MTPEEKAVINAAMAWRDAWLANPYDASAYSHLPEPIVRALKTLSHATRTLATIDRAATQPAEAEELIWVERTWTDVRAGDVVRLPGTTNEAQIYTAVPIDWHVRPGTGTSQYNPPEPLEHRVIKVRFTHAATTYEMDPDKPIEIQIYPRELAAVETIGWENRL